MSEIVLTIAATRVARSQDRPWGEKIWNPLASATTSKNGALLLLLPLLLLPPPFLWPVELNLDHVVFWGGGQLPGLYPSPWRGEAPELPIFFLLSQEQPGKLLRGMKGGGMSKQAEGWVIRDAWKSRANLAACLTIHSSRPPMLLTEINKSIYDKYKTKR